MSDRASLIAEVARLEELEQINHRLDGKGESFRQFLARVAPHHPPPRHLDVLIAAVERARRNEVRLCVSMPPGHAKSITLLRALSWWLSATPKDKCGFFGYNNDIGVEQNGQARDIATSAGLVLTKNTAEQWKLVQGGGVVAGGVGTSLTGRRITGVIVVDDPFKDRKAADSPTVRNDVWNWFNSVVMTRLEGASVIVVHTRWHPDDLIGRLEKMEDSPWEIINLPALCDTQPDPLGRQLGEALWPELYPCAKLKALEKQIGEYDFSALFQGQPRPRGAAVFGPAKYYDPGRFDPTGHIGVIGADPAASAKTSADYSAAVFQAIKGRGPEAISHIMNVVRQQTTVPNFVRTLRAFQVASWHAPAYVEAVAGFKAVPQLLKEADPELIVHEAPALGDKFQRALPVAAAWNDGRVLVPTNAPWLKSFLSEFESFTGVGDAQDDQVDAAAHGWNAIHGAPAAIYRGVREDLDRWR